MSQILVVEDDPDISNLLRMHLSDLGHDVTCIRNGIDALEAGQTREFDLVLLDLMLPGMDGIEICKTLRMTHKVLPIIMITSREDEVDKVLGLEVGADDYVTKPFSIRELVARIKGVLRKAEAYNNRSADSQPVLEFGTLRIDSDKRRVIQREEELSLTGKEFDLLYFLAKQAGRPFSREELLENVWGYDFEGYSNTVTSHINRLRNKVESDPADPKWILTVWGVGYRFAEKGEI